MVFIGIMIVMLLVDYCVQVKKKESHDFDLEQELQSQANIILGQRGV